MLNAPFWPATSRSKYRRLMPPPGIHTHSRGVGRTLWDTKRSAAIRWQPAGARVLTSTLTLHRRTASTSASDPVRSTGSEFSCATLNDALRNRPPAAYVAPSATRAPFSAPTDARGIMSGLPLGLVGQVPDTLGVSGENQFPLVRWDRVELRLYHLPRAWPGGDRMRIIRRPHDVLGRRSDRGGDRARSPPR